jgi:hypothetical protein
MAGIADFMPGDMTLAEILQAAIDTGAPGYRGLPPSARASARIGRQYALGTDSGVEEAFARMTARGDERHRVALARGSQATQRLDGGPIPPKWEMFPRAEQWVRRHFVNEGFTLPPDARRSTNVEQRGILDGIGALLDELDRRGGGYR